MENLEIEGLKGCVQRREGQPSRLDACARVRVCPFSQREPSQHDLHLQTEDPHSGPLETLERRRRHGLGLRDPPQLAQQPRQLDACELVRLEVADGFRVGHQRRQIRRRGSQLADRHAQLRPRHTDATLGELAADGLGQRVRAIQGLAGLAEATPLTVVSGHIDLDRHPA